MRPIISSLSKPQPNTQVYLVMDNAPYHHGHPGNSFFARGKSKEEIKAKLMELGCRQVSIQPYADLGPCPAVPTDVSPAHKYEGWVFCERTTGECFMLDGESDEGQGNVIVHTRIGRKRFTTIESAFEQDFRRLVCKDFMFVGVGEAAMMYVQSIMNTHGNAEVPQNRRQDDRLRRECAQFAEQLRTTVWRYDVNKVAEKYNGNGNKGTGGPPSGLLRRACDDYIIRNHPELRMTRVMKRFDELGWSIIWTVPYWAKSQPIELAWAIVKNYVARMYHPGRTHKDLRRQILCGMYGGVARHGQKHSGLTAEIAVNLIKHTQKHMNKFLQDTRDKHNFEGVVGNLTRTRNTC